MTTGKQVPDEVEELISRARKDRAPRHAYRYLRLWETRHCKNFFMVLVNRK